MIIKNAKVFTLNGFEYRDICISGERITDSSADSEIIDATGLMAIPGLIDIHLHGAMGHDFCDVTDEYQNHLFEIAKYEAQNGVLAFCPTTMTYGEERLKEIIEAIGLHNESIVGINLEGPFISPEKAGAQNPEYIMDADSDMLDELISTGDGLVKIIDIAPEIPGAMELIKKYGDQLRISIAHTNASYDIAKEAFDKGAKELTHIYNAMSGINHREPGPIIAAYERDAMVELIADGIHVHPSVVKFTFDMFGKDRVILISDSMEATGLNDGTYRLGGQDITVKGNKATLEKDPTIIAGSVTNLFDCMKSAHSMGVKLQSVIQAATYNPAKAIGVDSDYGLLEPGYYANIVLIDKDLNIRHIINKGYRC